MRKNKGASAKPKKPVRDESHYNKGSCDMRRVTEAEFEMSDCGADSKGVGEFYWGTTGLANSKETARVLWARYPDGSIGCIPINPVPRDLAASFNFQTWNWDGNEDKPTLSPSIHHVGCWHGYIRAGRMVSV